MVVINSRFCDRCKKEINTNRRVKMKRKTYTLLSYVLGRATEEDIDLCEKCTEKLQDFLNNK